MPVVGCCFALGAASIAALPPFNGFAGEFFLYVSLAVGGGQGDFSGLIYWAGLVVLAAVSGFTLLCFARLYGLAFLGEPRSAAAQQIKPAALPERLPQLLLCALCLASAFAAPWLASLITAFVVPELGFSSQLFRPYNIAPVQLLSSVNSLFLVFLLLLGVLVSLRAFLLRGRSIKASPTWDCGYAAPSARMQYSGGSFSQPATYFMRALLGGQAQLPEIRDYFPRGAKARLSFPDRIKEGFFRPLFLICLGLANWCKRLQHGRVNGYILYMLLVLVGLLAWKVGGHD
jgi:NADH:ubiquinone oxidoreductase subunit 5 (subunit L)/multisubunit Na+/H+ antiporter MnhA subunit